MSDDATDRTTSVSEVLDMMGGGGMMGGGAMGAWGAGSFLGPIFMILFWVLIIAGTIWLVLAIGQSLQRSSQAPRSSGLAILEERLARGEIDVEEYKARKSVLGGA